MDELTMSEIKHLYSDEQLTMLETAQKLGISQTTVHTHLSRLGIKRSHSEANHLANRSGHRGLNKAELLPVIIDLYRNKRLNRSQIADKLSINQITIYRWLKETHLIFDKKETAKRGKENHSYKTGRKMDDGYVYILAPDHPSSNSKGYIFEHRLVWEQVHNKPLPKGWIIHHLNGIRSDNRPENLVAMSRKEHIHQGEPYKKRIRELEAKVKLLERALDANQLIFGVSEN